MNHTRTVPDDLDEFVGIMPESVIMRKNFCNRGVEVRFEDDIALEKL